MQLENTHGSCRCEEDLGEIKEEATQEFTPLGGYMNLVVNHDIFHPTGKGLTPNTFDH